jgi:hypothetical protein
MSKKPERLGDAPVEEAMTLSAAQRIFLYRLFAAEGSYATYKNDQTWELPGGDLLAITAAEVGELEQHDFVGNYSRFNPHVIMDDWWSSRITSAGKAFCTLNPERNAQ